jgi:hypothetical protein
MGWKFTPAVSDFSRLRSEWDRINSSLAHHVLLDSDFVEPLIKCFGGPDVFVGINDDPSPAMVLVQQTSRGVWSSFQPSQAPLGMLLVGLDDDGEQLKGLLRSLPGFALQFSVMQQDPDYTAWPRSAANGGLELLDYIDTPRLTIASTFDDYWKQRSSNLRHNLSRQRRRLAETGRTMEFVMRCAASQVACAVAEYGRLESLGWKSETGTAIAADNQQGRFYTEVLERFSARHEAVIFQLRLDGIVVATDLCLIRNGMLVILKTTYDETQKSLSPALLLREDELRWIFGQGSISVVEFYGRTMDWHRKFTDEVRTMYHLNCYRNSWTPVVKKALRHLQ